MRRKKLGFGAFSALGLCPALGLRANAVWRSSSALEAWAPEPLAPWKTLRIRASNNTGTIVNESTRLASNATITETDNGENRYFAVPCNRNTGTNTIQMHSVESIVGTPTSP